MKVGSLCAGYGGIELGLRLADERVDLRWLAEFDQALDVLHPAGVPNLGDITAIDWSAVEPVDLLTAGFPCQPFSAAGSQLAESDPRYLWPAVFAAIAYLRPPRVLLENVRNLISMRKGEVWARILADLTSLGYDVQWLTLGACRVGAAHHRHRVFALATWVGPSASVTHLDVQECGARRGANGGPVAVPTPTVADARNSRNLTAGRNPGASVGSGGMMLGDFAVIVGAMLPTPAARDGYKGGGDATQAQQSRDRHSLTLDVVAALLPTPRASDHEFGGRQLGPDGRTPSGYGADLIDLAASKLLPTPTTGDQHVNAVGDRVERGAGNLRTVASEPERWGRFAAAVARHAAAYGPPPPPTEPNRNGAPRLAPAFAEWLMCIPAGRVTDALPRSQALKAIGNGVCPPQLAAAWTLLIAPSHTTTCVDGSLISQVLSPPMTEPTPPADDAPAAPSNVKLDVKEIQDRNAEHRGRVIEAGGPYPTDEMTPDEGARRIAAAMTELAAVWREQAAYFTAAKRRGWKSTAEQHIQAAAMLAGFAGQLTTRPVITPADTFSSLTPLTSQTLLPDSLHLDGMVAQALAASPKPMAEQIDDAFGCSHPPEAISVLPGGERLCTTCRHRWTVEVETQASLFSAPEPTEQEAVQTIVNTQPPTVTPLFVSPTSAPPAPATSTSPFVSPGPMGGRAQVRRLTFGELPALIGALPVLNTLSHSFVETYGNCSLQTLLDRAGRRSLGGITASRPSFSLIGGTAFHTVIETIERAVIDSNGQDIPRAMGNPGSGGINVEQVWAEALNLALAAVQQETAGGPYDDMSTWHVSQGGKEGYDWWRVTGSDMVRMYLDYHDAEYRASNGIFRGIDPSQPDVMIEREFTTTFGHTASRGFLDQAWVVFPKLEPPHNLPYIEIRDAKTGSREPKETLQLAEYAYAVAQAYPQVAQRPIMGSFWIARKGHYTTSVDLFRRHPFEELAYRFDAANAGQRAGLYTPNVTDLCVACSKRDYCPAQGRS